MAAVSTMIAAVGLGLGAIGTATQMYASSKASKASERAEQLRKKQMNMDAAKERREMIRQAIIARSTALSNTTASGSEQGGSALSGAYAGISNQQGNALNYNYNSQRIGAGIFDANAASARSQGISGLGSGISSLGGMFVDNADKISRLGKYYGTRFAT